MLGTMTPEATNGRRITKGIQREEEQEEDEKVGRGTS
jgi:hypothetical protein